MGIAVLAMKSVGDSVILKSKTVTPRECLRFALSQPVAAVVTGIHNQAILDQAFEVGSVFEPLTAEETEALLKKTEQAAARGEYELLKTSSHFDSTAYNPKWLGPETAKVKELSPA